MTYVTDFGVVEQPGRFNVDMYIHAATVTGAYHAADRRLKDWGIDWHLDNVEKGQDPDFDNNCPECTQANFMRMEFVDGGLYYLVLGVEKSELAPNDRIRLSAKAAQCAKKHGWAPYIDREATGWINIVDYEDRAYYPEVAAAHLVIRPTLHHPDTTAPLQGDIVVSGCCSEWVFFDGFRVKDRHVLLIRKNETVGRFYAVNVYMTKKTLETYLIPEGVAVLKGAKI